MNRLCGDGSDVRDEDMARLPPFFRHHINLLGRYSFRLPDLPAACGRSAPRRGSGKSRRSRHRRTGASWSQIGAAAGHSKQAGPEGPQPVDRRAAQQRETLGQPGSRLTPVTLGQGEQTAHDVRVGGDARHVGGRGDEVFAPLGQAGPLPCPPSLVRSYSLRSASGVQSSPSACTAAWRTRSSFQGASWYRSTVIRDGYVIGEPPNGIAETGSSSGR